MSRRRSTSREVSILVVMERTHRRHWLSSQQSRQNQVSILVVMERTHRPGMAALSTPASGCFNPCCDGTDSSTSPCPRRRRGWACFNPCCDGTDSSTRSPGRSGRQAARCCFNPCCDGTDSSTSAWPRKDDGRWWSFNPCCDGTDSSTGIVRCCSWSVLLVSILVVMERTHRRRRFQYACVHGLGVSILVVMERTHRRGP